MSEYAGDISPQQAWEMVQQGAVLVDVRTEAEWRFVGIPQAPEGAMAPLFVEWVNYPDGQRNPRFVDQLLEAGLEPGSNTPIVFLCRSGQRSIGAAVAATAAGMGPCYNISEGFEGSTDAKGHRGSQGWRAAGLPWTQA